MFERTMSQGRDPNRSDAQTDNTGEKGGTSRRRLLASGAATWATVAIFFQGENPAVYGGRDPVVEIAAGEHDSRREVEI